MSSRPQVSARPRRARFSHSSIASANPLGTSLSSTSFHFVPVDCHVVGFAIAQHTTNCDQCGRRGFFCLGRTGMLVCRTRRTPDGCSCRLHLLCTPWLRPPSCTMQSQLALFSAESIVMMLTRNLARHSHRRRASSCLRPMLAIGLTYGQLNANETKACQSSASGKHRLWHLCQAGYEAGAWYWHRTPSLRRLRRRGFYRRKRLCCIPSRSNRDSAESLFELDSDAHDGPVDSHSL